MFVLRPIYYSLAAGGSSCPSSSCLPYTPPLFARQPLAINAVYSHRFVLKFPTAFIRTPTSCDQRRLFLPLHPQKNCFCNHRQHALEMQTERVRAALAEAEGPWEAQRAKLDSAIALTNVSADWLLLPGLEGCRCFFYLLSFFPYLVVEKPWSALFLFRGRNKGHSKIDRFGTEGASIAELRCSATS